MHRSCHFRKIISWKATVLILKKYFKKVKNKKKIALCSLYKHCGTKFRNNSECLHAHMGQSISTRPMHQTKTRSAPLATTRKVHAAGTALSLSFFLSFFFVIFFVDMGWAPLGPSNPWNPSLASPTNLYHYCTLRRDWSYLKIEKETPLNIFLDSSLNEHAPRIRPFRLRNLVYFVLIE